MLQLEDDAAHPTNVLGVSGCLRIEVTQLGHSFPLRPWLDLVGGSLELFLRGLRSGAVGVLELGELSDNEKSQLGA